MIRPTRKQIAARTFTAMSLAEIQGPVLQPKRKTACPRAHRWVNRKHTRYCCKCGLEEAR